MFLRDQVEQDSRSWKISETQKQEFAKVMIEMQYSLPENINGVFLGLLLAFHSLVDFDHHPPSLEGVGRWCHSRWSLRLGV
jgi:hypothetical protein